jgi:hypothetical protein
MTPELRAANSADLRAKMLGDGTEDSIESIGIIEQIGLLCYLTRIELAKDTEEGVKTAITYITSADKAMLALKAFIMAEGKRYGIDAGFGSDVMQGLMGFLRK